KVLSGAKRPFEYGLEVWSGNVPGEAAHCQGSKRPFPHLPVIREEERFAHPLSESRQEHFFKIGRYGLCRSEGGSSQVVQASDYHVRRQSSEVHLKRKAYCSDLRLDPCDGRARFEAISHNAADADGGVGVGEIEQVNDMVEPVVSESLGANQPPRPLLAL